MKKISVMFVFCSFFSIAQNATEFGKVLPASVIFFGKDQAEMVQMKYDKPENFCNPYYEFVINGKPIKSELIDAFRINDETWASRLDPNPRKEDQVKDNLSGKTKNMTMAKILLQGAINAYFIEHKVLVGYTAYTYYQKRDGKIFQVESHASKSQVREWISDAPEIIREFEQADSLVNANKQKLIEFKKNDSIAVAERTKQEKKKGVMGLIDDSQFEASRKQKRAEIGSTMLDLNRIIHNYNVWYNRINPGQVQYYFQDLPERMESQYEEELALQRTITEKRRIKEKDAEDKNRTELLYANRSTTAAPEYASAKNNVPVKKETFTAKLDRIKADGNKVGVLFVLKPVQSPPKPSGSAAAGPGMGSAMSTDVYMEGEYFDESLMAIGEQFTSEINLALGRSDIEMIDINNVPYRNAKVMGMSTRIDNFWASKYKIVFILTINPLLKASVNESASKNKYSAFINLVSSLFVNEYVGDAESKDTDIITQMSNFGSFSSSSISQEMPFTNIETTYKQILEKYSISMVEKAKAERELDMKKLIEKKLK